MLRHPAIFCSVKCIPISVNDLVDLLSESYVGPANFPLEQSSNYSDYDIVKLLQPNIYLTIIIIVKM